MIAKYLKALSYHLIFILFKTFLLFLKPAQ